MTHGPAPDRLHLMLFIGGASPASAHAVRRLRDLCDRNCPDGYDLETVDVYQQPALVVSRGVVAVPTLIKDLPPPVRLLVGDFADESAVLTALGLPGRTAD
jgi:circadian clock protein KaiB